MSTIDQTPLSQPTDGDRLSPPPAAADGRIDGRVMRGLRNRRALIDSYYALAGELGEIPRASDVAERAGVSVRSLFQHFSDLDDLRLATVDEMCQRAIKLLMVESERLDPTAPVHDRLDQILRSRAVLWEMLKPLRIAHLLRDGAEERESTSDVLDQVRDLIRDQLRLTFTAELANTGLDEEIALTALQLSLSSHAWDHIRLVHGHDVETAIVVMRHLALSALARRD